MDCLPYDVDSLEHESLIYLCVKFRVQFSELFCRITYQLSLLWVSLKQVSSNRMIIYKTSSEYKTYLLLGSLW